MAFPYYVLTPTLYDELPVIFRQNGFEVVAKPPRRLPESSRLTFVEDESERTIVLVVDHEKVRMSYFFDSVLGHYVAYALLDDTGKPILDRLRRQIDPLLLKHGASLG